MRKQVILEMKTTVQGLRMGPDPAQEAEDGLTTQGGGRRRRGGTG